MTLLSRLAAHLLHLPPPSGGKVVRQRDIAVPMRDGTLLRADRWSTGDTGPVVLVRTPYGRGGPFALIYRLFAERGLQVVVQSCRGTGGSEGRLDPMRQEAADGLDTLDWVRAQPWFAGKLYTYGSSYVGFTQWAIAQEAGQRIDGMVLHVTLSNFRNETLAFGGFTQEGSLGWTRLMKSLESGSPLAMLRGRRSPAEEVALHAHLPVGELDEKAVGAPVSWWRDWVNHDDPADPWWSAVDHSAKVAAVPVPMAMIGGWRDIFLPWQIEDFCAACKAGRPAWLTVGPWSHAARDGFGESIRQGLALFGGGEPGPSRVRLYVQGADEWRDYPDWPPPGARETVLHLRAGGALREAAPEEDAPPTAYRYDPADPTPALHGPRLSAGTAPPDMSPLEQRDDTVSFDGDMLARDLDIVGPLTVSLSVRADREHFDLFAILCDVDDQGRPLHISDGYRRLRPDAGTNGVREVSLTLWPTAYRLKAGHRLRLIVASGAHPRYARNPGTGEPLASATALVPVRIEILHDKNHRSSLRLSVEER